MKLSPEQRQQLYEKLMEKQSQPSMFADGSVIGSVADSLSQIVTGSRGGAGDGARAIGQSAVRRNQLADMNRKERLEKLLRLDKEARKDERDTEIFNMNKDEYNRNKEAEEAAGIAGAKSRRDTWNTLTRELSDLGYDTSKIGPNTDIKVLQDLLKEQRKQQDPKTFTENLTPGQEAADKQFGKDVGDWTSGGNEIARNEIDKLKDVTSKISNNEISLGRENRLIPDLFASNARIGARADVHSTVMKSLKAILGAQFTEKEGERVFQTVWNENDTEENNLKRLNRLIDDLTAQANAKDAKVNYYNKYGTLKGFGTRPTRRFD